MPVIKKTETKYLDPDIELDPEDKERDEALERAFVEHDSLSFDGVHLRPVSAGTIMLLQRSKNRLLMGDTSNVIADAAAFVLIHAEDNSATRQAIFRNELDELVYQFLDETEDAQKKLMEFSPVIARMMQDYLKTQTTSLESGAGLKKKSGRRTG
jgi:hypothetical protein